MNNNLAETFGLLGLSPRQLRSHKAAAEAHAQDMRITDGMRQHWLEIAAECDRLLERK